MSQPDIVLHQFYQSHYCIRIRWVLNFKGLPFKTHDYDWGNIDEVAQVSGGWEHVPVLLWNGKVHTDSARIAAFLESMKPEPPIFSAEATPGLCNLLNSWVDGLVMRNAARFMADKYGEYIGRQHVARYEREMFVPAFGMTVTEAAGRKSEWQEALEANWRTLESALDGRRFLLGARPSYADFGVASRLRLMEIVAHYELPAEFAQLKRWFHEVKTLGRDDSLAGRR